MAYYVTDDNEENFEIMAQVVIYEYNETKLNKIISDIANQPDQTLASGAIVSIEEVKVKNNSVIETLVTNKKTGIKNLNWASAWKSSKFLIYIGGNGNTGIPEEILSKYLDLYPSDL